MSNTGEEGSAPGTEDSFSENALDGFPPAWEILSSEMALDQPWYRVRRDKVRLPNGKEIDDYFISLRPEVVLVFPVTISGEVILVRQYKHGAGKVLVEFPGGILGHPEEPPAQAATRELEEETGYLVGKLEYLTSVWDDPAKQNNRLHLFLATECVPDGKQHFDPTEFIQVLKVPLADLRKELDAGLVQSAGSLALAWHSFSRLGRE